MKKIVSLSLLSAILGTGICAKDADTKAAPAARPAASADAGSLRIGIVSATDVGAASESKDLQTAIMELRGKYENSIKSIDAELQSLVQQAQSASQAKMKNKVEELQEKITRKQQEREIAAQSAERGLQRDAQKLVQESQDRFLKAVEKVAQSKGLDLILQREQALYQKPGLKVDITEDVIKQWDKDYATHKAKKAAKAAPKK